jgi:catechol 2,3-dioxygenase-like lactoylglutathione lyase family enzyme
MLDHLTIRVSNLAETRRFYSAVLDREPVGDEYLEWDDFSIAPQEDERLVTRHLHVAFAAQSREDVDALWRRGIDAGYRSDGEPGLRPQYADDYYGGFLLDPDGYVRTLS